VILTRRYRGRLVGALLCVAGLAVGLLTVPAASAAVNPDTLPGSTATRACGNGINAVAITPAKGFNPLTVRHSG
jgi:hypothetical protein